MRRFLVLDDDEINALLEQDPATARDGGFQSLMVRLQENFRSGTQELRIEDKDLDDIQRYALDYNQGGWEERLMRIFRRNLGPTLGREESEGN